MKLFYNYSIDCELPPNTDYTGPERKPFFHGPETWQFAEESVRGFVERMAELDCAAGTTLFVYPDVATHQRSLYREMANAGVEVALHLNGLRYSRLRDNAAKWLGEMSRDEQREALRMAKADLEDVVGQAVTGYRACYGSANDDTLPLCEELGFTWTSNSSGRYRPEFCANWWGSWPYPHHGSASSRLIPGDLALYEMPVTSGRTICYEGNADQPLDLRVETPPSVIGEDRSLLRAVIEENVVDMERRETPIRMIAGASHNTRLHGDKTTDAYETLGWLARHTRDVAAAHGMTFTPARFDTVAAEAQCVSAY